MKKGLKITVSVVCVLLTMVLAVGCSKKAPAESGNQDQSGNPGGRSGMLRQRNPEEVKTSLAPLVKDGTITQQQADNVITYLEKQAEERQNITPEERRAQWGGDQSQRPNQGQRPDQGQRPNPLSELVESGTITQQQADKIAGVLFQPRNMDRTESGN